MPQFIVQTRVIPPKLPKNYIPRTRLTELLNQNVDKSLILICSRAGSGKSTLVQDFLRQSGLRYAWVSASSDMNDFFTFMEYLVYALKQIDEKFGARTLEVINSLRKTPERTENLSDVIKASTAGFINEFCRHLKDDVMLVIDDLHNIEPGKNKSWLNEIFNFLLENIPDNLHLIIISRDLPQFNPEKSGFRKLNMSRLNAKRKLFQLGAAELKFDVQETQELLSNIYSVKTPDDKLKKFLDKVDGWITGIHLLVQALDVKGVTSNTETLPEDIFDFFAEEILSGLEPEMQNFLLLTSLLDNFDEVMCDSLLNVNNSGSIIEELLKKNIFLERNQDFQHKEHKVHKETKGEINAQGDNMAGDYYSYYPLFRDFLSAKLIDSKSRGEINAILSKISDYYDEKNDKNSSIRYALRADNYEKAAEDIIPVSSKLIEEGRFEIIWDWLTAFEEGFLLKEPNLLLLTAKLHRQYTGELEKSLYYVNQAISLFEAQNKTSNLTESLILKADLVLLLGNDKEALEILKDLLKRSNLPQEEASIYHQLGRLYNSTFQYGKAIEVLNKSLTICQREGLDYLKNNNFLLLSSIYQVRGEFIKSIHFNEQVSVGERDVMRKFRGAVSPIFIYSYSGRYGKARKLLDDAEHMLNDFPLSQFKLGLKYAEAKMRRITGDYERSIEILEEVVSLANKLNRKYYFYHSYMLIAEDYNHLGMHDKAIQYHELAGQSMDLQKEEDAIAHSSYKAILYLKNNYKKDKEKNLLNGLNYYESSNLYSETAQVSFHLADFYLNANDTLKALKFLEDSLRFASENEDISLYENKVSDFRELFEFGIANNVHKDLIRKITKGYLHKPEIEWLSEKCKERLRVQIENFYDVSMAAFGELSFTVRGKPVPEKLWTRKKSKVILAYLILNPDVKLPKDKAVDLFFPELPMDKAEPQFHNCITNIRNALGGNKNTVLYEDKILRLNSDLYYKSDADEFNKLYELVISSRKPEHLMKIKEIYRGEFMAGVEEGWCNEMRQVFADRYSDVCKIFATEATETPKGKS